MDARPGDGLLLVISFLLSLILYTLPLPAMVEQARPEWVMLVLLYWAVFLPTRLGVGSGWLFGLLLDVMHGTLLGRYALACALLVYLSRLLYQQLRMFPAFQQVFVVFILIGLQLLLLHWIDLIAGTAPVTMAFLIPAGTSALCWPLLYFLLHAGRLRFGRSRTD